MHSPSGTLEQENGWGLFPSTLWWWIQETKTWREGGTCPRSPNKLEPRSWLQAYSHQRAITFQNWKPKDREDFIPVVAYHRLGFQLWWEAWAILKLVHVGRDSSIWKTWIHTRFISADTHLMVSVSGGLWAIRKLGARRVLCEQQQY